MADQELYWKAGVTEEMKQELFWELKKAHNPWYWAALLARNVGPEEGKVSVEAWIRLSGVPRTEAMRQEIEAKLATWDDAAADGVVEPREYMSPGSDYGMDIWGRGTTAASWNRYYKANKPKKPRKTKTPKEKWQAEMDEYKKPKWTWG